MREIPFPHRQGTRENCVTVGTLPVRRNNGGEAENVQILEQPPSRAKKKAWYGPTNRYRLSGAGGGVSLFVNWAGSLDGPTPDDAYDATSSVAARTLSVYRVCTSYSLRPVGSSWFPVEGCLWGGEGEEPWPRAGSSLLLHGFGDRGESYHNGEHPHCGRAPVERQCTSSCLIDRRWGNSSARGDCATRGVSAVGGGRGKWQPLFSTSKPTRGTTRQWQLRSGRSTDL